MGRGEFVGEILLCAEVFSCNIIVTVRCSMPSPQARKLHVHVLGRVQVWTIWSWLAVAKL